MLPSDVPNQPTSATTSFSRTGELMATVQQAIETNLPKGPTKNVLGHTKKTRAPVLGQQAQFMNTQARPRGTEIDPVKALEELQYMKATYQHWIQSAASRGQGNTQQHKSSSGKRLWVSKRTALDGDGRSIWGGSTVRKTKRLFRNLNKASIDQGFWRSWLIESRYWYTGGRSAGRYSGPLPTRGRGSGTETVHEDLSSKS